MFDLISQDVHLLCILLNDEQKGDYFGESFVDELKERPKVIVIRLGRDAVIVDPAGEYARDQHHINEVRLCNEPPPFDSFQKLSKLFKSTCCDIVVKEKD